MVLTHKKFLIYNFNFMKIEHLKKLEKNKTIGKRTIKGISDAEIQEYERKLNISFPVVYKEFLSLAGKDVASLCLFPRESRMNELLDDNEVLLRRLQKYNVDLERPLWVFTEYDGDDPMVYRGEMTDITEFKSINVTFSEYVDELVDRSISFAKRGY